MIDRLLRACSQQNAANAYEEEIARAVQHVVVDKLIALADAAPMAQVRAMATLKLRQRMNAWSARPAAAASARVLSQAAMNGYLADEIRRFLDRPLPADPRAAMPEPPPGAPIGDPGMEFCSVRDRF